MKIAILNNAANYLYFNVNFAKYLESFDNEVVFLNTDKFISKQLQKHNLKVKKYSKINKLFAFYNENSNIIKYLKRLHNIKNTKKLISIKNTEYSKAYEYFKNNNYDYVLLLNGAFNVETDVCKELKIKTFFFEHAYFPKAIQMDSKGVNSNTSFANLTYDDLLNFKYKKNEFQPLNDFSFLEIKYKMIERYFYRLFDFSNSFVFQMVGRKRNLLKASKRFKTFENENSIIKNNEKFILFPLQVNSDTQIILNSKYSSMYEAIDDVLPALKKTGLKIIVKEHPMEVEPVNYTKYADDKQVFIVKKVNLDKFIDNAEFVVNINSSVGFQAIAKYKKVVLLGNSFYKNSPSTIYFEDIKSIDLLDVVNELNVDKEKIDRYINYFKKEIFLKGHFYTPDVNFFERIRNRLI